MIGQRAPSARSVGAAHDRVSRRVRLSDNSPAALPVHPTTLAQTATAHFRTLASAPRCRESAKAVLPPVRHRDRGTARYPYASPHEEITVSMILASDVSARVRTLIARNDGGNARAAAHALGIDHAGLAGLLSGDWQRFSLDALAALVRGYGVSPTWLLAADVVTEPASVHRGAPRSGGASQLRMSREG